MATPKTDARGQIQKRTNESTLVDMVQASAPQLARAMPEHLNPDRMVRIAITAIRQNPKLAGCSPVSFMGCLMQLAQLGLEPNTPLSHAWLIPRNNYKTGMECTVVVGYQGMIELALRSGVVTGIFAHVVRKGDKFGYRLGLDPNIEHVPSEDDSREDQPITHVYAVARILGGDPVFVCMSRAQVLKRRERSDGYNYQVKNNKTDNPWFTDEEAMFKKTAVRDLAKWIPKSVELARAIKVEDAGAVNKSVVAGFDHQVVEALASEGYKEDSTDANSSPVDALLSSIATMSSEDLTMLALPNGLTADELASINGAIDERLAALASEKGDSQ